MESSLQPLAQQARISARCVQVLFREVTRAVYPHALMSIKQR